MNTETNETMTPETEETVRKTQVGTVVNCARLNVRKRPNRAAQVVTVINAGTVVKINDRRSTEDFYNVTTENGKFGYCMKQYIEVEE